MSCAAEMLEQIDRDDLRAHIAFVFQEPNLFDSTLAENIRFGRPDASEAHIRRAAGKAAPGPAARV